MRTTARSLTGTALAAVCLGALAVPAAYAGDFGTLELSPSTAKPGTSVTVSTRACGPNGHGVGDAQSLGAGEFKLRPGAHKELAVGTFRVPEHTKPGTYGIAVACDNGKTASGDLVVRHGGGPTHHPTHHPTHQPTHQPTHDGPRGHVKTGVGGSVGPDATRVAAGAAILAGAVAAGAWALRRRTNGGHG
ncbi:hypothetical protein [Streptomyces thermolilacinus]|uniref:Sortase n=1 Tax=Streptomyces thermolilacinus SPC6 TaxID=1306406 RepID=A0A1D3DVN1_9ACTN|nr:hypothetical protein [Streptomyces thermolilacinus]OEJ96378.1 hypothetical protein J116_019840 [Streptomyces thermolilacinus SPC6]